MSFWLMQGLQGLVGAKTSDEHATAVTSLPLGAVAGNYIERTIHPALLTVPTRELLKMLMGARGWPRFSGFSRTSRSRVPSGTPSLPPGSMPCSSTQRDASAALEKTAIRAGTEAVAILMFMSDLVGRTSVRSETPGGTVGQKGKKVRYLLVGSLLPHISLQLLPPGAFHKQIKTPPSLPSIIIAITVRRGADSYSDSTGHYCTWYVIGRAAVILVVKLQCSISRHLPALRVGVVFWLRL